MEYTNRKCIWSVHTIDRLGCHRPCESHCSDYTVRDLTHLAGSTHISNHNQTLGRLHASGCADVTGCPWCTSRNDASFGLHHCVASPSVFIDRTARLGFLRHCYIVDHWLDDPSSERIPSKRPEEMGANKFTFLVDLFNFAVPFDGYLNNITASI